MANPLRNSRPARNPEGDLYVIPLEFTLNAGATLPQSVQVPQGADFEHIKSTYAAYLQGANATPQESAVLVPNVKCTITDSTYGRQLSLSPVYVPAWFGTRQFPFILPQPRIWVELSTITITCTNYSNDNILLELNLVGIRRFPN